MRNMRWPAACAMGLWLMISAKASACLAPYRSLQWLVTESPLVIVGKVTAVEFAPEEKRTGGDGNAGGNVLGSRARASVATIQVLQVLKGDNGATPVKLRSGPIESCAWDPVHYAFIEGEVRVFVVSGFDAKGAYLRFGGSVRDVSALELVKAALDRAVVQRRRFVDRLAAEAPKALADGEKLAAELARECTSWPKGRSPDDRPEDVARADKARGDAIVAVAKKVETVEAPVIQSAIAVDADPLRHRTWSAHSVWREVAREHLTKHRAAVAAACRVYWRKELARINIAPDHVKAYLDGAKDEDIASLDGPPSLPHLKTPDGEAFTTDFIARYHCGDPGWMFVTYGMKFDSLAKLNPIRAAQTIAAMYGSADESVRRVAERAIDRADGTHFVNLVLERQMDGDVRAWAILDRARNYDEQLKAMVDRAYERYERQGIAEFWESLTAGRCFARVCIAQAIERLARIEQGDGKPLATPEQTQEANRVRQALVGYLEAAKSERLGPPVARPAKEYRRWFDQADGR
jgi:hypothetical protein